MVPKEIEQIRKLVDNLESIDIAEKISKNIEKVDGVIENTMIGDFSALAFINFFELAIKGLNNLVESDLNAVIPQGIKFEIDGYHSGYPIYITEQVGLLSIRVNESDFASAATHLKHIIYFLNANNLLPKDKEILKAIDVNKLSKEIDLKRKILNNAIKEKDTLFDDLDKKIEKQNILIEGLQDELKEANRKNDAINELLLQSTKNEQKIVNLTGNFEHGFERLETLNNIKQNELAQLKNDYEESLRDIRAFEDTTFDIAKRVQENSADFDTQLAKLNELVGKQAASSLFSTFKTRKEELSKPVTRWTWITFFAGAFALFWVMAVFTNFFGRVGNQEIEIDTTFLILNSLKSVPAIILLYFSIRQYVRERNMQEEYAFRSAIALTIQAYGDMVGDKKHELIMAATATIYTMPTVMKERSFSLFRKKDNGMIEIMKQLNETLKTTIKNN